MCAALATAGFKVTATDKRADREPVALAGIDSAVLQHALAGSSAASTLIRDDVGLVFDGDYLACFGLDRICGELGAVTTRAADHQAPWELSKVVRRTYHRALAR